MIHGAGGATQSWRGLFPILAQKFHVVAVDLPGQGFTQAGSSTRFGLDETAADLLELIGALKVTPSLVVGHSAGVPIAMRLVEKGLDPKWGVVGINAALANFKGVAGWLFPILAKTLATTPLSAALFTATATPSSIANLIKGTGSELDAVGQDLYLQLARDKTHVQSTLTMMAQWSLDDLLERLPGYSGRLILAVGERDQAVPPATSVRVSRIIRHSQLINLKGLGHLAHEEDPKTFAKLISDAAI